VTRFERIRGSRITLEVVSWTIGIVVVLVLTLLVSGLADHLGVPWP
jgi:hypothetical protein